MRVSFAVLALLGACSSSDAPRPAVTPSPGSETVEHTFVLRNVRTPGGAALEIEVEDGIVSRVGPALRSSLSELDGHGAFVVPGFIDSHVHLAYYDVSDMLPATGIVGAVDLAAPEPFLDREMGPLRVLFAGPMITAESGYPTESWGRDGFGLECRGEAEVGAAVERLIGRGASVVKLAVAGEPELTDGELAAAVRSAHALGVKVVAHALRDRDAARAAAAGVDVLAHTPVERLSDETVRAFADRAVISTLSAFGGSRAAIDNLRRLREAGATVLYGTDLGNTRVVGLQPTELELLGEAGLDGAAIVRSLTETPSEFFGMSDLGALEPGRAASFVLVEKDPFGAPDTLIHPLTVYVDGTRAL